MPETAVPNTTAAKPATGAATRPARSPLRRTVIFGLFCGPVFLVLIALGGWQINRLAWKEAILAQVDAAERAAPVPLPAQPTPYEKVTLSGTVVPGSAGIFAQDVRMTGSATVEGGDLVAILRPDQGPPVLVDLGWIPDGALGAVDLTSRLTLTGFAQVPQRANLFTPKDDPAGNRFYLLDPARIGAERGVTGLAPFVMIALGSPPPRGWPQPATGLPRPANDHLQYALTWFSLAGMLLIQFLYWTYKVFRP